MHVLSAGVIVSEKDPREDTEKQAVRRRQHQQDRQERGAQEDGLRRQGVLWHEFKELFGVMTGKIGEEDPLHSTPLHRVLLSRCQSLFTPPRTAPP